MQQIATPILQQVHQGVPLGGDYYLRRFPVWFNFRGNSSVLLSEAKALSVASAGPRRSGWRETWRRSRRSGSWAAIPSSASIMYGEGYDWTPLYSVRSGQMVGALPVGIETRGDSDAPYWPTQICWTYKEVWTQPAGEWIWLMRDLNGPAVVRGVSGSDDQTVEFRDEHTGFTKSIAPSNGAFRVLLPQGQYSVRQGTARTTLIALSAGSYDVDLHPDKAVDYAVTTEMGASGEIVFRVAAHGSGLHTFSLRADNLDLKEALQQTVGLTPEKSGSVNWHAHILSANTPWVAVVIADNAVANRREVTGTAHLRSSLRH